VITKNHTLDLFGTLDFAHQFPARSLNLRERSLKVSDNRRGNVLGIGERFLGPAVVVTKPCNIQIVIAVGNLGPLEAAEAPALALINAGTLPIRVISVGFLEICKVLGCYGISLANAGMLARRS
jgi:hypothetical protein